MASFAAVPADASLRELREAAGGCKACSLWERGTQTVFGEGRERARVLLVGEQPGNDEDLAGKPFVGPAGRLLDQALAEAGIDRGDAYVTNVPRVVVCLGATAAEFIESPLGGWVLATVHPSSMLRAPDDETRRAERARFVEDLKKVAEALATGR